MDIYAASLPGCPGLGAKSIRNLISAFGSAEDVWKASDESVRKAHLLSPKAEDSFLSYRAHTSPEETEELLYRLEIRCCTWEDENYPPLLAETSNPPAVLFYKGQPPVWEKTIAVVGMRKATPYGLETANRISSDLAKAGVTIVSGGARGIDSASHKQNKILPSSFLPAVLIKYILRKIKICFKRLLVQEAPLYLNILPVHRR